MGYESALEHLTKYREAREKALDNRGKQKWFTTGVATLSELFTSVFDSAAENSEWQSEDAKPHPDDVKLQALRLKVLFLARDRRDLRRQFAVDTTHRFRGPLDYDRTEYMRLAFARARQELFKQVVDSKESGVS